MLALNRNPVPLALLGYGAGSVSGSGIRPEPLWAAPSPTGRCSAPARSARPRQTSRLAPNPRGASGSGLRAASPPPLLAERRPPGQHQQECVCGQMLHVFVAPAVMVNSD